MAFCAVSSFRAFGYVAGNFDKQFSSRISSATLFMISLTVVGAYALALHYGLIRNWKCFTIIESITPYLMILLARQMLTWQVAKHYLLRPTILRIGINSLSFFVISNSFSFSVGAPSICRSSSVIVSFIPNISE